MLLGLIKAGGVAAALLYFWARPDLLIQYYYQVTLLGCAILVILYVWGLKDGIRFATILFGTYIIIRVLAGEMIWTTPVEGVITQEYKYMEHWGTDIAVSTGTEIRASRTGVVSKIWSDPIYGLAVIINHGDGMETLYAHNSKILVKEGESVETGEVISISGNTGNSTGPHLHFEIRKNGRAIDSEKYVHFGDKRVAGRSK